MIHHSPSLPLRSLIVAFLFSLAALGRGDDNYIDWIEPASAPYLLLQRAAAADGTQTWAATRLKNNLRLPQASARELSFDLEQSPRVDVALKQQLIEAFPDECNAPSSDLTALQVKAEALKSKIDSMNAMIDDLLASKKRNNYSPATNPQISVLYQYEYKYGGTYGLRDSVGPDQNGPMMSIHISQNFSNAIFGTEMLFVRIPLANGPVQIGPDGWTFQGIGGNWDTRRFHTNWGAIDSFSNMNFKLTLDPDWFRAIAIQVGGIVISPLDPLICASRSGNQGSPFISQPNPFFKVDEFIVLGLQDEQVDVVSGSRPYSGIYLEKVGTQGLWIFDSLRIVYSPTFGGNQSGWLTQQDNGFGTGRNTWVGRLDLAHRNLWLLQDADLWFCFLTDNTEMDFSTRVPPVMPNVFNRDYSVGVTSQFLQNGQYSAQVAMNHWYSQGSQPTGQIDQPGVLVAQDLTWDDTAYMLSLSKPFAPLSFVLNYSEIGPRFVVGTRNGLWTTNDQYGGFLDSSVDDPRPGNRNQVAYETMDWDSQNPTNNGRRASLNLSYASGWGSIGLNPGFNTQIQSSGPWIQTARYLGNNWVNGGDWFNVLFANNGPIPPQTYVYTPNTILNGVPKFNEQTRGPAYYNGTPVNVDYGGKALSLPGQWNWQDAQTVAQPSTFENILLSQNGVGDPNLRADSVKTVNFLRGTWNLDFQSMFGTTWPLSLAGYSEIRDVSEQISLASYSDQNLLSQQLSEGFLSVGCSEMLTLQGYAGYETWLSTSGFYPLESHDSGWGWGFDLALSRYLSGLNFLFRNDFFTHDDSHYGFRNWDGYLISAHARLIY